MSKIPKLYVGSAAILSLVALIAPAHAQPLQLPEGLVAPATIVEVTSSRVSAEVDTVPPSAATPFNRYTRALAHCTVSGPLKKAASASERPTVAFNELHCGPNKAEITAVATDAALKAGVEKLEVGAPVSVLFLRPSSTQPAVKE